MKVTKGIVLLFIGFIVCALNLKFVYRNIAPDPLEILKKAEMLRAPWQGMSLNAKISNDNDLANQHKYQVYYQQTRTLVLFVVPEVERGNLLLMNGNDLWYYVSSTSRPTRITPIQRLSGSTSFGDITRLSWSADYNINSMVDTELKEDQTSTSAYKFLLSAKSAGATYQKMILWINKKDFHPIKSEVFLSSGKIYKTLIFSKFGSYKSRIINSQITFIDHFNKDAKSILNFSDIKEDKNIPNRYFISTTMPQVSNELSK